jgi:hypothetical protein
MLPCFPFFHKIIKMPSKRKKSHNLKQPNDPLGKKIPPPPPFHFFLVNSLSYLDDILRKNLYLTKYAQSADQLKQLGK